MLRVLVLLRCVIITVLSCYLVGCGSDRDGLALGRPSSMDDFPVARVLLLRHASAAPKAVHPDRPLTGKGQREARSAAEEIAKVLFVTSDENDGAPTNVQILHSGKLRAQLTAAEVEAAVVGASALAKLQSATVACGGLAPNDDPAIAQSLISKTLPESPGLLVLVGHLPHACMHMCMYLCMHLISCPLCRLPLTWGQSQSWGSLVPLRVGHEL